MNPKFLDPKFDYDFSSIVDTDPHQRGPELYNRPCGWMRFAINVSEKHGEDMNWLATGTGNEVWPVAYHGTKQLNVPGILANSLQVGGDKTRN